MKYCGYHEIDYSGADCPRCIGDARHKELADLAREQQEQTLEAFSMLYEGLRDDAANPGVYACPHCRFRTLLWEASRCPKCQGSVEKTYWQAVTKAQQEEESRLQTAEEEEKARRAAEKANNDREMADYIAKHPYVALPLRLREMILVTYDYYLLPLFTTLSVWILGQWLPGSEVEIGWIFIPLLNWLQCLGGILGSEHSMLMLNSFVFWVFVGKFLRDRSFNPRGPEYVIYSSAGRVPDLPADCRTV